MRQSSHLLTTKIHFRRLLYVACTRAQALLYLSHANMRKVAGETKTKKLSEFVSVVTNQNPVGVLSSILGISRLIKCLQGLFSSRNPDFRPGDRAVISKVLGRSLPDEGEVSRRVADLFVCILKSVYLAEVRICSIRTSHHHKSDSDERDTRVPWDESAARHQHGMHRSQCFFIADVISSSCERKLHAEHP